MSEVVAQGSTPRVLAATVATPRRRGRHGWPPVGRVAVPFRPAPHRRSPARWGRWRAPLALLARGCPWL